METSSEVLRKKEKYDFNLEKRRYIYRENHIMLVLVQQFGSENIGRNPDF